MKKWKQEVNNRKIDRKRHYTFKINNTAFTIDIK